MNYIDEVYNRVLTRNPNEPEFLQAIKEVFNSLSPVLDRHPKFVDENILERMTEPERQIIFKVPWIDDQGKIQVNRGYRIQFNGSIGPYKGGLRFHPSVYLGIVKFLGFEQMFKNALTGLPIGGGKGGSDFDPKGKSDREIMRFCQSFMTELYRHIGPNTDVPAGDIGVGGREIAYLFGQYRRIMGTFENGVLTGKGLSFGGSYVRKEAAGYGLIYFLNEMLNYHKDTIKNKVISISGSGNVAIYACEKAQLYGGKVVTMSDSSGYIYDSNGINLETIKKIKEANYQRISEYVHYHPNSIFIKDKRPWEIAVEIALPCATQNDLELDDAKMLVKNGVKVICEGANMPCTIEATNYFIDKNIVFGPSKAANAGGVATSALEMSQNSMRYQWTFEEVDHKLKNIMIRTHSQSVETSNQYGYGYQLVAGANIAGFTKVANAMIQQGIY